MVLVYNFNNNAHYLATMFNMICVVVFSYGHMYPST